MVHQAAGEGAGGRACVWHNRVGTSALNGAAGSRPSSSTAVRLTLSLENVAGEGYTHEGEQCCACVH